MCQTWAERPPSKRGGLQPPVHGRAGEIVVLRRVLGARLAFLVAAGGIGAAVEQQADKEVVGQIKELGAAERWEAEVGALVMTLYFAAGPLKKLRTYRGMC